MVEVLDSLAEEGGVDSEGGSVVRVTPVTSVEGPDTGPWTAKDQVIDCDAYSEINTCSICLDKKNLMRQILLWCYVLKSCDCFEVKASSLCSGESV